jgi:hypothetical protein
MSYPIIVSGKSVKLSPKSEKSNTNDAAKTESSKAEKDKTKLSTSNAAELSNVRSVDSDEPNPNIQYASAVDFTRMPDSSVASATVEETSSGVAIRRGLFTMCVVLVTFYSLF